jgi:transcriptional regulator with XRE-family HTH domain
MSKEQLAVHLDVSISTIERWEWGQTEPTASKLAKIAERLKREPGYFLRSDRVSA